MSPFTSMEKPALVFPGQASTWQLSLHDSAQDPATQRRMAELIDAAEKTIEAVSDEVNWALPEALPRLRFLINPDNDPERIDIDAFPAVSMPAILLATIAATEHLAELGLDLEETLMDGHSQGIIGISAVEDPVQALAFAITLGAGVSTFGTADARSHMMAIAGPKAEDMQFRYDASTKTPVSVINGNNLVVVSGRPAALAETQQKLQEEADAAGQKITFMPLDVGYHFHIPANQRSANKTVEWVDKCGISIDKPMPPQKMAQSIVVEPMDFRETVKGLLDKGATQIISLDSVIAGIIAGIVEDEGKAGTVEVIEADTRAKREQLAS